MGIAMQESCGARLHPGCRLAIGGQLESRMSSLLRLAEEWDAQTLLYKVVKAGCGANWHSVCALHSHHEMANGRVSLLV